MTYALTRFAWAAGIPLGISREFLTEMQDAGLVWAGPGWARFATVGAVLTLGWCSAGASGSRAGCSGSPAGGCR